MEQKITIRIAGKDFVLKASSPENEELIRLAAIEIGKKLLAYQSRFTGRELSDILSFVALNEAITALTLQRKLDGAAAEADELSAHLEAYLAQEEQEEKA